MQITISTDRPSQVVREVYKDGRVTHLKTVNNYTNGKATWTNLTTTEFVVLEDIAVRLGLEYDGSQAEEGEHN